MKISIQTTTVLMAFVAMFAFTVSIAHAEETAAVTAETNTSVQLNPNGQPVKRPLGKPLKAVIDNREANKDIRNNTLEKRVEIIKERREDVKEIRTDARGEMKDARGEMKMNRASSTDMFKKSNEIRKEIAKKMETKVFEVRKNALVKELNLSITNLTSISTRIEARITKAESEGKTLTDAKTLLVTAKEKLETAKTAVAAFSAVSAPVASTDATATAEVDLAKPRQVGDAAIKAVKEARDAFQKVVQSIAHSMGVKAEVKASSETSGTITN